MINLPRAKHDEPGCESSYLDCVTLVHSAVLEYGPWLLLNMDEVATCKVGPPPTAQRLPRTAATRLSPSRTHASVQKITTIPCK